jgi:hypothetical protein
MRHPADDAASRSAGTWTQAATSQSSSARPAAAASVVIKASANSAIAAEPALAQRKQKAVSDNAPATLSRQVVVSMTAEREDRDRAASRMADLLGFDCSDMTDARRRRVIRSDEAATFIAAMISGKAGLNGRPRV